MAAIAARPDAVVYLAYGGGVHTDGEFHGWRRKLKVTLGAVVDAELLKQLRGNPLLACGSRARLASRAMMVLILAVES